VNADEEVEVVVCDAGAPPFDLLPDRLLNRATSALAQVLGRPSAFKVKAMTSAVGVASRNC